MGIYGTATWDGYRNSPEARDHLSLEELLAAARRAGGDAHHFRAIQLPHSLAMPEAFVAPSQLEDGGAIPLLAAAARRGMLVSSSASIYQSHLARGLPAFLAEKLPGLATDAQRAIQFARSTPGLTTALVGMKREEHVEENLATARVARRTSLTIWK